MELDDTLSTTRKSFNKLKNPTNLGPTRHSRADSDTLKCFLGDCSKTSLQSSDNKGNLITKELLMSLLPIAPSEQKRNWELL